MAEQFDVKLAEGAMYPASLPEYREESCVRDHDRDLNVEFPGDRRNSIGAEWRVD